jgi:2-haloacid dehalogenase
LQKLKNIKACVFDAYGTLFDVVSSARECADELGDTWINFSAMWRRKQLEYTWLRSMMGEYEDFWHVTGQALDYTMETFNVDNPALRAKLMSAYLRLRPYDEVERIVGQLKERNFKIIVLSNGSMPMLHSAIRTAGFYDLFDKVLSVDAVKVFKVSPKAYQYCADDVGLDPSSISYQSTNAWDVAGAKKFGFNVVWINRFNQKPEKLGTHTVPDIEIRSLHKLPEIIE